MAQRAQPQRRGTERDREGDCRASLSLSCPVQPPVPGSSGNTEPLLQELGLGGDRDSLICAFCSATIPKAVAGLGRDEELAGAALQLTSHPAQHPRIYHPARFLSRIPVAKGSACCCPSGFALCCVPKGDIPSFPLVSVVLLDAAVGF